MDSNRFEVRSQQSASKNPVLASKVKMSFGSEVEPLQRSEKALLLRSNKSMTASEYVEKMRYGGVHADYDNLSD